MEVILLEKVANLGGLGEKVSVKSGFGRNFLIPQGKAVFASAENVKLFEERRADLEGISITHKSGEEGRLFGSVGTVDIASACAEAGVEISKSEVRLPEGPFRVAGEHEVTLHLHTDVDVTLKVNIIGED